MVGNLLVTSMVWLAGLSSWAATLISVGAIWSHCKNYSQPHLQRWVVRIIMMVPIYALTAWASLISVDSAYYLDTVRDIYEAFVIYCFVSLLIAYFGGERAFLLSMHGRNPTPLFWPASLARKDLDLSDPYDYLFLKRGILQYVVVKPLLAATTMLMKSLGVYHDGNWAISDGYLWTQLVYNASVSLSLYCLVVFYMATRESLAQWNPLPKFLCVKAIVFFSYWQGLGISILVGMGLIHDTPAFSAEHIATFLQSWLICLEMIGGAFGHWISFSYLDYVPSFRLAGRVRLFHALKDAFGFKDVIIDAKSAWSGHLYTYQYFDPIVPVDELDVQLPMPARQRTYILVDDEGHVNQRSGASSPSLHSSNSASSLVASGKHGGGTSLLTSTTTHSNGDYFGSAAVQTLQPDPANQYSSSSNQNSPSTASAASSTNPIKERRLRAGMRYTQGGKKTYWLPVEPVDHRAVAFAAGGAGMMRAKLLHGNHAGSSNIKASLEYAASAVHSSSHMMHESRRVHKHSLAEASSSAHATVSASHSLSPLHAQPATEHTYLLVSTSADPAYSNQEPSQDLSALSMDLSPDEYAHDDAIYDEARGTEGDFNYPVMEVGVAFGYSRRRPYGNTLPRRNSSASTHPNAATNTRTPLHHDQFDQL
ncbi:organic solute transporter Ostalpha-domain-containing protein [Coemansia spiralis]|nr:organic solute transporter Ostalpha-domain-containing protein [Coemansia spiralis]